MSQESTLISPASAPTSPSSLESPRPQSHEISQPHHTSHHNPQNDFINATNTATNTPQLHSLDAILASLESFEFDSSSDEDDDENSSRNAHQSGDDSNTSSQSGRAAFLAKCHSFDHYRFPTQPILSKLSLTELNLAHCGIGDKGAMALGEALKVNTNVRILALRDNWITPKGLHALVEALIRNKTVLSLDLSDNRLGMRRLVNQKRCGELLARLLEKNLYLEHLYLKGNGIGDADVLTLCDFLCEDNHLRTLDLSYNEIGPVAGTAIKTLLSTNGYLKYLNLEWNALRDEGSLAVLEGLKNNNVLEIINMAWCGVSSRGAPDIATVIQENTSLVEMNLEHNTIEYEQGIQYIAPILKENSSIRRLLLSHNPIGKLGVMAMLEGAQDNSSLELSLDNVGVDWRQDIVLKVMCERAQEARRQKRHLNVYELEQDVLQEVAQSHEWRLRKLVKPVVVPEKVKKEEKKGGAKSKTSTAAAPVKKTPKKVKTRPMLEIKLPEERYVLV